MATKPKIGIPVRQGGLGEPTGENPNDYVGANFFQPVAVEAPVPEGSGLIRRVVGDGLVTAVKSAIGVPEVAVGLADMVTGGHVGKALENEGGMFGFRPEEAKSYLDTLYSPEQRAAFAAVQNAANKDDPLLSRIADIGMAAIRNPSTIVHAVGESLPSIGAGGVIAGTLMKATKAAGWAAAGVGEGVVSAGSTAEQIRQGTKDGLLTGQQSLVAAGSGALTMGLGMVAAKAAKAMGIGDIDVMFAGGGGGPAVQKNFVRRVVEGAFAEGVLEELPQTIQERLAQNFALGKPLDEGVDVAAVMGALSGGAMGFGANALPRAPVPEVGPLSRAANVGAASAPPEVDPARFEAPTVALTPEQSKQLLDHANKRAQELQAKAKGSKGVDGAADVAPQFLTPKEQAEQEFLQAAGGDDQALARAYKPEAPPLAPIDDDAAIGKMEREAKRDENGAAGRARAAGDDTDGGTVSGVPEAPTAPTGGNIATPPKDSEVTPIEDDLPFADQDDIVNPAGDPFKTRFAAGRRQANLPDKENYTIVPVNGGFVVRRIKKAADDKPADTPPVVVAPGTGSGDQPGGSTGDTGGIQGRPGTLPGDAATAPAGSGAAAEPVGDAGGAPATVGFGPTAPEVQPTGTRGTNADDILNPKGDPFKTKAAADAAQKKHGGTVVEIAGGFAVRPHPTTSGPQVTEIQPAGTRGTNYDDVLKGLPSGNIATGDTVDDGAHGGAASPTNDKTATDEQILGGNAALGHTSISGLDFSIENPAGTERVDKNNTPPKWRTMMQHHYGYIKGTIGNDKDHVDAFVKPGTPLDHAGPVFVVDQIHPETGKFDEHKALIGFADEAEARAAYAANYAKDWAGLKAITEMPWDEFKTWVKDGPKTAELAAPKTTPEPVPPEAPTGGPVSPQEPNTPTGPGTTAEPTEPKPPEEKKPRPEDVIELRKRISVLNSLLKCMA